jgi:hypothetical protein
VFIPVRDGHPSRGIVRRHPTALSILARIAAPEAQACNWVALNFARWSNLKTAPLQSGSDNHSQILLNRSGEVGRAQSILAGTAAAGEAMRLDPH